MDATLVGGMTGVLGALVGGSATIAAAWITQRTSSRRELVRTELQKRETLYGEFINECLRLAKRQAPYGMNAINIIANRGIGVVSVHRYRGAGRQKAGHRTSSRRNSD